jgi:hypothetical protein
MGLPHWIWRRQGRSSRRDIVRAGAMLTFGHRTNEYLGRRNKMKFVCKVVGWLPTAQLIKEMALALGIAITVQGVVEITGWGLSLLGGAPWPVR